ncbi:hypothetical protein LX36DRAFT_332362 [Colletotrichum falcatum]|nr:hypothetical protein LX36DRAFT_332362 [Colletotrichum falcatum]
MHHSAPGMISRRNLVRARCHWQWGRWGRWGLRHPNNSQYIVAIPSSLGLTTHGRRQSTARRYVRYRQPFACHFALFRHCANDRTGASRWQATDGRDRTGREVRPGFRAFPPHLAPARELVGCNVLFEAGASMMDGRNIRTDKVQPTVPVPPPHLPILSPLVPLSLSSLRVSSHSPILCPSISRGQLGSSLYPPVTR